MIRLALAALVAAVTATTAGQATPASTGLRVVYRPSETAPPRVLTLRCDPARGTVPRPATACQRLRTLGPQAFAPPPPGRACTQIFGGPQTALVTGTYLGRQIWVRLDRVDGCAIGRWNRLSFLFPPSGS